MAASRTRASSLPEELQREAQRINEQLYCLGVILDKSNVALEDMTKVMIKYSPDMSAQIKKLQDALLSYKDKSRKIYGELSESLLIYAKNLMQSLNMLTEGVNEVAAAISEL